MIRRLLIAYAFALVGFKPAAAEDLSLGDIIGQTPYVSPSCSGKDHHEMRFMEGIWDMKVLVDGLWVPGGFSIIRPALGGCAWLEVVSQENWGEIYEPLTGRMGFGEITISSYDRQAKNWRHIRMDDMGAIVTDFRGRKFPDGMRFVGPGPDYRSSEMQRFEWRITGDGLRELVFEQSKNGGQSWSRLATVQMIKRAQPKHEDTNAATGTGR